MHEIPKLDKKGLRDFGLLTGVIFVALFGLLLPWLRGHGLPRWPWGVSATLWFLTFKRDRKISTEKEMKFFSLVG